MRHGIEAGDFTLLSEERQNEFVPGIDFKESLEDGISGICKYIREIFSGGSLSDLSSESGIEIEMTIFLSNYAKTYRELRHNLKNIDPRIIAVLNYKFRRKSDELGQIIQSQESFSLNQISRIIEDIIEQEEIALQKQREAQKKEGLEQEEIGFTQLIKYFMWNDTPKNREYIQKTWLLNGIKHWESLIEYFKEKGIQDINDENEYNNSLNFVAWKKTKNDDLEEISYEQATLMISMMGFKFTSPNSGSFI